MSRKLHSVLGYYVPAFFEMHIDIDSADMNINNLSYADLTVLFHEYIHFLQDRPSGFETLHIQPPAVPFPSTAEMYEQASRKYSE